MLNASDGDMAFDIPASISVLNMDPNMGRDDGECRLSLKPNQ